MGFYQPLFTVSVDHMYFSDGLWKGLDFVPNPGTSKLTECANVLLRQTANGIGVFYDEDKARALRLYADKKGRLRFSFKVYAKDRSFANYTGLTVQKEGAVLRFDNRGEEPEAGIIRLSKEDFVSGKDFKNISALIAKGMLCESDKRVPPDFVVNICIKPGSDNGLAARHYGIKFGARQSYWQYYLLGNMNRSNLSIVDLDNRVTFEFRDEVLLGNRRAKVFRSKQLIPVLEESNYRFQLREQGAGAEKVLIKRLPVASEAGFGMEMIDRKPEIVSESYINF